MAPRAKRRVGIFWDVENCGIPSRISARVIVERIKAVVKNFGEIVKFNAYGDTQYTRLSDRQEELHQAGVRAIVTPHNSKPQVADMRIIADIIAFAVGSSSPVAVILISSDGDFAHAVSIIQAKGHIVWIISGLHTSAKLAGLADGRMSWNDDIVERVLEVPRNSQIPQPPEEDERRPEESRIVNLCDNANYMIPGFGLSSPVLPCQTSTTSYYAGSSLRVTPVQTCTSLSSQSGQLGLCSPVSIITSTPFLNSCFKLSKPDPPPSPVSSSPPPAPARIPPPRPRVSSPGPETMRAPATGSSCPRFGPLITLLRQIRATNPDRCQKLRAPEVTTTLRKRDPSIFRQYKKPKTYLKKAINAGIIIMTREEGHPPTISLHPDYY